MDVNGLPDEEFPFLGDDRFGSTDRNVSFRAARNASGEIVGLHWSASGQERLTSTRASLRRSHRERTRIRRSLSGGQAVRALGPGAPATELPQLAPGARANFAGRPIREPRRRAATHAPVSAGPHRPADRAARWHGSQSAVLSDGNDRGRALVVDSRQHRQLDHRLTSSTSERRSAPAIISALDAPARHHIGYA